MARRARIDNDVAPCRFQIELAQRERIAEHFQGISEAAALRQIIDFFFQVLDANASRKPQVKD